MVTHPRLRRLARLSVLVQLVILFVLSIIGDIYVHHSAPWLDSHRSNWTATFEYLGNRMAYLTDAIGWTGEDLVLPPLPQPPTNALFFAGAPQRVGSPAPTDLKILDRGAFQTAWSPSLRHPTWVAYRIPAEAKFEVGVRPGFRKDRREPSSSTSADYVESLYDRGHMAPNHAIVTRFGPVAQTNTFLMTNIAPQRPTLNRGPWREMELRLAEFATALYGDVWVIVGAIASDSPFARETLSGTRVVVPDWFYMIAVTQDAEGLRAVAVLMDNQSTEFSDFPVHTIVPIAEIERLSGFTFFPDLPADVARALKTGCPTRLWPVRLRDLWELIRLRFPSY